MTDKITEYLKNYDGEPKVIMEVCGTHTASISENGIPSMLSDKIKLVSGPGCPVCVTVSAYIDKLVELALTRNVCVVTFGDLMRVRGSERSLSDAAADGANVEMVYSPFDIFALAEKSPDTLFVFAAVGFETTTPIYALMLERITNEGIDNIKFLTALKTMPEAIRTVARENSAITGFLAPGHVSVITGSDLFSELAKELGIPFAVAGFTGGELLAAIYALTKLNGGKSVNMYTSVVTAEGNTAARECVKKYFTTSPAAWRGFGIIENSGLILRGEFARYDAGSAELTYDKSDDSGCRCGAVTAGRLSPAECPLFSKVCTPSAPRGACMVSTEGSCFHYYMNNRK
ncbi:MAG: hydrogenase formation protein HypD [Firmicutes bacterium]|nr:hydrogenase formation protein HypD [Bacillota bacterium]